MNGDRPPEAASSAPAISREWLATLRSLTLPEVEGGMAKALVARLEQLRYELIETAQQLEESGADESDSAESELSPDASARPRSWSRRGRVSGMPSASTILGTASHLGTTKKEDTPREQQPKFKRPESPARPTVTREKPAPPKPTVEPRSWRPPVEPPAPAVDPPNPKVTKNAPTAEVPAAPKRPKPRPTSQVGTGVRWWSIPVVWGLVLPFALILGLAGAESLRSAVQLSGLNAALLDPAASPESILTAGKQLSSSPLARWDARRELLLAEATLRSHPETPEEARKAALRHLERASNRAPGSIWHLWNLASLADGEEAEKAWKRLAQSESREPALREASALRQWQTSDRAVAIESLRKLLREFPERALPVVEQLLKEGMASGEALEILPDSPRSLAALIPLAEKQAVIGLRPAIELRLTRMEERATKGSDEGISADDWLALGDLHQWLGQSSQAVAAWKRVATDPGEGTAAMLRLARLEFEQKQFAECVRWVNEIRGESISSQERDEIDQLRKQAESELAEMAHPERLTPIQAN